MSYPIRLQGIWSGYTSPLTQLAWMRTVLRDVTAHHLSKKWRLPTKLVLRGFYWPVQTLVDIKCRKFNHQVWCKTWCKFKITSIRWKSANPTMGIGGLYFVWKKKQIGTYVVLINKMGIHGISGRKLIMINSKWGNWHFIF